MRLVGLTILGLISIIAYIQRLAFNVPALSIQKDLELDSSQMGWIMSGLYWAYAIGQIPSGWLIDRFGTKWVLFFSAMVWSLAIAGAGMASTLEEMFLAWFVLGLGQAALFPACSKLVGNWYPQSQRASASGVIIFCQTVGIALAPLCTATLLGWLTWREVFQFYCIPGMIWAVVFLIIIPSPARYRPDASALTPVSASPWRIILTSYPMMLLCAQQFLRGAAMVFFFTWFPTFLRQVGNLSEREAGQLSAYPGLGAMCGGLLGGFVSDLILRGTGNLRLSRQGLAVFGMTCCTLLTFAAFLIQDVNAIVALFALGAFFGTLGGVSGYSVAIELGGTRVATVFASMNMCGNVGAAIFPLAIGWAVAQTGSWSIAILAFATLFALDAILWALLNPKRPLFEDPA